MKTTLLVHAESRPFAADLARLAGMILGPSRIATPQTLPAAPTPLPDFVVLIDDQGRDLPFATPFVTTHHTWLKQTRVALLTPPIPPHALITALPPPPGTTDLLRATVPPPEPHKPNHVGRDSIEETVGQILALERANRQLLSTLPRDALLTAVETFLRAHDTCVLAVSFQNRVRAAPIQYTYEHGHIYMITEGGQKLGHLLANPDVALTVFEPLSTFDALAGLQLSGKARVHPPGTDEHARIIAKQGITDQALAALAIDLFVIDVTLHEADLLDAGLEQRGYTARQRLVF